MAKGKVLLLTTDAAVARVFQPCLAGLGLEVTQIAGVQDAVGQSGWPFDTAEAGAIVADLGSLTSAEAEALLQVQKDKGTFSLLFLRPASYFSPSRDAALRALPWPLPEGFADSVLRADRPIVLLADRTLWLARSLPVGFKAIGLDCVALEEQAGLPEFLRSQPSAGPEEAPGLLGRILGRKAPAPGSNVSHVAVLPFTGDAAEAEALDRKVRKTSPRALCYTVSSVDPMQSSVLSLKQGKAVILPRERPHLVGAVLAGAHPGRAGSSQPKAPVLLVETDPEVLSSLARPLLAAGYQVKLAASAAEALTLAGRRGEFHVAILGMSFACSFKHDKDGVSELAQSLRKADPDLRFIFVIDVYPMERALREMSRALEFGADDGLLKPTDPVRLLSSVERALDRRRIMTRSSGDAAPPPSAPGAAQSIIGSRYDLVFQVGEGGMGVVYLASDRELGRKVALKKMRPELKLREDQRAKFIQEAKIISHLSHPYIVGIHEIVEEEDELYLVLDYVEGMPLSQVIIERGRLSFEESRGILASLCHAIDYAHGRHVLHRDLKPANIMIDKAGFVKVMDFGLAWEMKATITMLTQSEAAGTLAYMAPEQHLGKCGKPSDLYALGVCLYEMLTGEIPFQGPDFLSQKERRFFTPLSRRLPGLPPSVDQLMSHVLSPDPTRRFASAAELYESLVRISSA